jgi:membrane-associated phospholipid phosphatase
LNAVPVRCAARALLLLAASIVVTGGAQAAVDASTVTGTGSDAARLGLRPQPVFKSASDYAADLKGYVLAPFRLDRADLRWAGGALAATALAYALDDHVRARPFAPGSSKATRSTTVRDALPLVALTAGTFAWGELKHDSAIAATGTDMAEAALLSYLGANVLKFAAGRLRPDQTLSHSQWRKSGSSFPSDHVATVFAAAQVLSDRLPVERQGLRWTAYGLAGATAIVRINGNKHWLSDTVAGAALGLATGRFVSQRRLDSFHNLTVGVAPTSGGMTLQLTASLN